MLNAMQKHMLEAVLDYTLQGIQRRLAPTEALLALQAVTEEGIFKTYRAGFAEVRVLGYLQQLRSLLQHLCPQNRALSLAEGPQEQGMAVWKDAKTGEWKKEPLGLLGLTTQNEANTPPVTAADVREYTLFKLETVRNTLKDATAAQPVAPALIKEVEQLIWQQAELLIKGRKEREALPLLKQLTSSCAPNADYFYEYARCLAITAQRREALAAFNQAIQLRPEHAQAYVERGLTLEYLGDINGALRDYTQALSQDPAHAFALCQRAGIYFSLKQITKAERDYQKSLQYKSDANTYRQRGERYLLLGRYEQALKDFTEALSLRPDWPVLKALQQEALRQKKLVQTPGVKEAGVVVGGTLSAEGLVFGDFLGAGSYGTVCKGTWQNQTVAIKRLACDAFSETASEELQQEASVMKQLKHPNIIKLHGVCRDDEKSYLLLEYAAQGSVYNKLKSQNPPSWPVRWKIALDAGRGLKYLHEKKILHRDLKSANVVLDAEGVAKLCDFGMAVVKLETRSQIKPMLSAKKEEEPSTAGTVRYMAPECFEGEYSKASDVYSFGMLLWELAACKVPFNTFTNVFAVIAHVKAGQREKIPADTPPSIAHLIQGCWTQEPAKRPKIEEVVKTLEDCQQEVANASRLG